MHPERNRWRVCGTAERGTAHVAEGTPCQDAVGWRVLAGDVLVAVLADGAGGAARSDEGSRRACEALPRFLAPNDEALRRGDPDELTGLMREVFRATREDVMLLAADGEAAPAEFACTLIGVVAAPGFTLWGQIGDGGAVVRAPGGELITLAEANRGEYLNETTFLTSEGFAEALSVGCHAWSADRIAVFSDGLEMLALRFGSGTPHPPFFEPLFAFAFGHEDAADATRELTAFLNSPRVSARTTDDKSLILAVRGDGDA